MLMEEGLDTGAILESLECDIKDKNSSEVFELLANWPLSSSSLLF